MINPALETPSGWGTTYIASELKKLPKPTWYLYGSSSVVVVMKPAWLQAPKTTAGSICRTAPILKPVAMIITEGWRGLVSVDEL